VKCKIYNKATATARTIFRISDNLFIV